MRSLLTVILLPLLTAGGGCAMLQPSLRYGSDLKVERVPLAVEVEASVVPPRWASPPGSSFHNPIIAAPPEVLALSLRDALRADLATNGPFRVADERPQAVLVVNVTRLDAEATLYWLGLVLPLVTTPLVVPYLLLGLPAASVEVRMTATATLIDGQGRVLDEVQALASETRSKGLYYHWGAWSYEFAARPLAESLRQQLASHGKVIMARLDGRRAPVRTAAVPAIFGGPPAAAAPAPPSPLAAGAPGTAAPASAPGAPPALRAAPQPTAYALIVGIETYRDAPAAPGAEGDVRRVEQLMRHTFGIPAAQIKVLTRERASGRDIERQLKWAAANVPANGRIYFYFSGHGAPDPTKGTPYLVPYDGDPAAIADTGVALDEALQVLGRSKAREVIVLVDACFSGAGGRSLLPPGARPLVVTKTAEVSPAIVLLSAAGGAEIAGPAGDGRGGLFTNHLIDALATGSADANGDGQISARELIDWLQPRVARAAKRDHREQTPTLRLGSRVGPAEHVIISFGYPTK
ncbi:MAG TPA: caspase family protein [Polyangia bacterium]|jgi:hypothetical protein